MRRHSRLILLIAQEDKHARVSIEATPSKSVTGEFTAERWSQVAVVKSTIVAA